MAGLADLLQGILGGLSQNGGPVVTAVGDHANPAAMQAQFARFAMPQGQPVQAPQLPAQGVPAPQAPQVQPQAQPAPQAPQGGGLGDAIGGILQNIVNPQASARNQTVGWLQKQGLDQGTATLLASNKPALQSYLLQRSKGSGPTEFDQRAAAAAQYGLDPNTDEGRNFILSGKIPEQRGGSAEMSLNTIPGVDEQGNSVLIQVDKAGVAHKTAMPAGVQIAKPPMIKDIGTGYAVIDPITRETVQIIPKDIAGAERQATLGKAQGGAEFDLPRVEQNAQQTLDVIEKLKAHPGRETATGVSSYLDPRNYLAGTDATNFKVLLDQAKGQTFLQAYQTLKGGGQITEVEGTKAENAIARLNTAQSDDEFMSALNDFESVIRVGLERAKQQAGGGAPASSNAAPASAPQKTSSPTGETPPASYDGDPNVWKFMTPEQKKLWQ